jgi:CheY-like chemotaxis protein
LAKAESGTVRAEMAATSTAQLRSAVLREFEHVAEAKGIGFSVELAAGVPDSFVTDSQRLRQILTNLLANAFKFTEQGEVKLTIGHAAGGWSTESEWLAKARSVVALTVADTGIGIEEEQHQRIFEAFSQGDGTTARLYGGTGLGLSISRELVGLLGGEIAVVSAPNRGSTFTVFLPVDGPEAVAPVAFPSVPVSFPTPTVTSAAGSSAQSSRERAVPAATQDFHGTKVLVVDDDFRNIFAMTALLERGHAVVSVAESGTDAIAILSRTSEIDLVLMDIMMPIMDGYATIRAIREIDRYKSLPIIAVTGRVMPGERQRCMDAGANDFVPKPVDTAELLSVLTPWLPTTARRA